MKLDPDAYEVARAVDEDLGYLMDEWVPKLDRAELRRISPILRRLLVEGDYGRAWRSLGLPGEPSISAPSIDAMLGTINRSLIQIALAPPDHTVRNAFAGDSQIQVQIKVVREIPVGSQAIVIPGYPEGLAPILAVIPPLPVISLEKPEDVLEREIKSKLGRRVVRGQPLTAYLSSPAAVAAEIVVSRRDVIQYVANKVGGVHSDSRREGAQGDRFKILDRPLAMIEAGGKRTNFAFAELLSIAEFLAESSDAGRYRREFSKAEPDEPEAVA